MNKQFTTLSVRLDRDVAAAVDKYRGQQVPIVSRSSLLHKAIELGLLRMGILDMAEEAKAEGN
jgi:hypothetical protein